MRKRGLRTQPRVYWNPSPQVSQCQTPTKAMGTDQAIIIFLHDSNHLAIPFGQTDPERRLRKGSSRRWDKVLALN